MGLYCTLPLAKLSKQTWYMWNLNSARQMFEQVLNFYLCKFFFLCKYVFRRVFHSGFQCKYMFYISFRVKLSGIKAMAQKHLKWSISQKVLLQGSELLTGYSLQTWILLTEVKTSLMEFLSKWIHLRAYPLKFNPYEDLFWESPRNVLFFSAKD